MLDFSTLLPGPLATLILAEAGAEVVKVERPGGGDDMRLFGPRRGGLEAWFALMNRGKRSLEVDLKSPAHRERLAPLLAQADVLVEQFRPGVMARLGLDYESLRVTNPGLVYCSISGYGQTGPKVADAGHDLNYLAESGLLSLTAGPDGGPALPPALMADVAGGAYPAVINILLALARRAHTGQGACVDVAMHDGLFSLAHWVLAAGAVGEGWPAPGPGAFTGASPRYRTYATADGRHLAAAPLEDRFWSAFCEAIDLPEALRDDGVDPQATARAVAERIASRTAADWLERFAGRDVCCSLVASAEEGYTSAQVMARGLLDRRVEGPDGISLPALPVPVVPELLRPEPVLPYPWTPEDFPQG